VFGITSKSKINEILSGVIKRVMSGLFRGEVEFPRSGASRLTQTLFSDPVLFTDYPTPNAQRQTFLQACDQPVTKSDRLWNLPPKGCELLHHPGWHVITGGADGKKFINRGVYSARLVVN
jgi:hypothetical protein